MDRLPVALRRLPGKDESKYLIEEVGVAVIPVPRLLFELLEEKPKNSPASLVTIGGVAFDTDPIRKRPQARESRPGYRQREVEGARRNQGRSHRHRRIVLGEDEEHRHKPGRGTGDQGGGEGRDGEARRLPLRLARLLRRPQVHPQAHGETRLVVGSHRHGAEPEPACGLVCAGANKPTADSDGILNALEVMDLDLTKVELAVLSACETGLR